MRLLSLVVVALAVLFALNPAPAAEPPKKDTHGRGYLPPSKAVSAARHAASNTTHAKKFATRPKATAASYDCRTLGQVPSILDQDGCGDCYWFSGTGVVAGAHLTATTVSLQTNPGFNLSVQFGLDYHPEQGGCNGGDEWSIAQLALTEGFPATSEYGGSGWRQGRPQSTAGMTFYKISAMGYCDPNAAANSVASTQSIKDSLVADGPVSVAVAAGSGDWNNCPASGLLAGPNLDDTNIDHAVMIVAWFDNGTIPGLPSAKSGGYWLVRNQWGTSWGLNGYAYVPYGGYSIGTEAFWVTAAAVTPPGPPVPPVPTPASCGPVRRFLRLCPTTAATARPHLFPLFPDRPRLFPR